MSVRLYAMICGWLTLPLAAFLEGEDGEIHVPVPCYLIDHPKGKVLFDSGLSTAAWPDPAGYLERKASYIRMHFSPGEELTARLAEIEVDPGDVTHMVNSHLHFDHVGGNAQIPNAPVVIQRAEWRAGRDPDLIHANGYLTKDYDLGHDVREIDGEHDLFGDGAIVCLPTFGHTPGHQSLRVRLAAGDVVLAADACYLRRSLEEMHPPRTRHDREATLRSFRTLRALRDRGARIFYGHDPEFWDSVPKAPAEIV